MQGIGSRFGALMAVWTAVVAAYGQEVPQAVKDAVLKADAAVAAIVAVPDGQRTFENTVKAFDDAGAQLDADASLIIFMQNVAVDPKTRDEARAAEEYVNNWEIGLGKREDVFRALKAYADTKPKLDPLPQRLLDFTMRDYKRAGMALSKADRDKLTGIEEEIGKLQIQFNQNVADDPTVLIFNRADLDGVPEAKMKPWLNSSGEYVIPLGEGTYSSIAYFAKSEDTRHKAWLAYQRRGGQKNVEVLEKIIKLRDQQATMLGYATTAAFESEIRMAKTPEHVAQFYKDLIPIVRKKSLKDFEQFQDAKRAELHDPKAELKPWDGGYYQTLLARQKYAVDQSKVAEYFPVPAVLKGLFDVTQSLYGVTFKDVTAGEKSLWTPEVKYYEVDDNATGEALGHFYLDLYPRPGKYSHAACWGLVSRRVKADGTVQLPIAALVTNVTRGTAGDPGLLPHEEVQTIFHEFGHVLHNLLTQAPYARFAGAAVERDFVEAPSQMFENWVWDPAVLRTFARHYKTGEPMPDAMLKGLIDAKNLGSGIFTEGQIFLGTTDQLYYSAKGGVVDTTAVGIANRGAVTLFQGQPGTMFQAAFGHLMHYQAGYYSYLWSLVFAQDMFQRFQKMGLLNPDAGRYYREHILAKGGTEDGDQLLRDYLGREPSQEAFLKYLGLSNP